MSATSDPALPRRQLGRYMRELRTEANLTIADASRIIQWSPSMLQRMETGRLENPREVDIRALCKVYDANLETTDAMVDLGQQANEKSWWHDFGNVMRRGFHVYVGLEAVARSLQIYQPELIPGLLQTGDYARELIAAGRFGSTETDQGVRLRLRRQKAILRTHRPMRVDAVIGEAALRRVMGSHRIMAIQLRRIDELMNRDNISIGILPFSAGYPTREPLGQFVIVNFGDDGRAGDGEPPIVYQEGLTGELYQERDTAVRLYKEAFDALQNSMLNISQSRNLIRELMREHERAQ
ncbi:helix-turn-helix domain-containing protein [Nocardia sp. NPDC004340]